MFADQIQMQNRLFAELSKMFGAEVPLYDKSLLVNFLCNQTVGDLLALRHRGFQLTAAELERTSGERHGAIRIGTPAEYHLIGRFFAAFAMLPHNFYDMANVGAKSQPIIATAFRSRFDPDHRIFTSLLLTDYFDPATEAHIKRLLGSRKIFSTRAIALLEKNEHHGGLAWPDAEALIAEGVNQIFKWTASARDHDLYQELCRAGFKIAADIACFESHHLNHLTPNTFCMDLYTAAMKFCLGELSSETFSGRAQIALQRLLQRADRDWMRLHFKHAERAALGEDQAPIIPDELFAHAVTRLLHRLQQEDLQLTRLAHSGFKDFTEGPSEDTPVLLRQDAYKALTEPVRFRNADGTMIDTVHTARFGEIEQRFYATTPKGRELYDRCLTAADAARDQNPGLAQKDFAAYQRIYARPFAAFPKTLPELLQQGLVHARYRATEAGRAAKATIATIDLWELIARGWVDYEGLRYEDFLPISAAGIFASNLNQYGTKATAAERPVYTQIHLEAILGRKIIAANETYSGLEAESLLHTYAELELLPKVPAATRLTWEKQRDRLHAAA